MNLNDAIQLEEELASLDPADPRYRVIREQLEPIRQVVLQESRRLCEVFKEWIKALDAEARESFGADARFEDVLEVVAAADNGRPYRRALVRLAGGLSGRWKLFPEEREDCASKQKPEFAAVGLFIAARGIGLDSSPSGAAERLLTAGRRHARAWLRWGKLPPRDKAERTHVSKQLHTPDPLDQLVRAENAERILGLATPAERQVLELLLEGATIAEAAGALSIRDDTARQRLYSFRRRISDPHALGL